jgi:cytochrome c biogenesis protein CcdA
MLDAPLAIAFTSGMVATFNPCGFAMLPAYLGTFLGLEDDTTDTSSRILRALSVGGALTLGFVVVFGLLGVGLSTVESIFQIQVEEKLPWVTMLIGVALVGLGVALLSGRHLTVALPKLEKGTRGTELGSMFLFGVSYAVASLSCTLPIFLAIVSQTFSRDSFLDGVAVYIAYALGMGLVLMSLTLLLAFAKHSMVHSMKRILPYVDRVAGGLLVLAGGYVAYYGWYELQVFSGNLDPGGPAEWFFDLNSNLNEWVKDTGATRVGLVLGAVVVGALLIALGLRADKRAGRIGS